MFRKLTTALLLVAALAIGLGAVPGVFPNIAHACEADDPGCDE